MPPDRQSPAPNTTSDRLAYIDALRGIAIAGVILTHVGSLAHLEGPLRALTGAAASGVQMFFVVSAFTILLSLGPPNEPNRFRRFFIKRFFRLFPLYWFGIALYFVVYGLESRGFKPGPEPWHFVLHATLTNVMHPLTTTSVVPGGWSISVEMLFYLTVPFWVAFVRDTRGALIALAVTVAIGSFVPPLLSSVLDPIYFQDLDPFIVEQYWKWSFPSQIACFGFGVLLYYLIAENRLPWLAGRGACAGLIAVAGGVAVLGLLRATPFETFHVFAAAYMLLALALSRHPFGFFVNRLTLFAGRVSYSAYLLHFLVLVQMVPMLRDLGLSPLAVTIAAFVLGTPITLALAAISFRFIETPAIRLGRRLAGRAGERRIGATARAGEA